MVRFRGLRFRYRNKKLIPLKFAVYGRLGGCHFIVVVLFARPVELCKINSGHQLVLHMAHRVVQCFHEFIKIFFVQKDFVFFIGKPLVVLVKSLLTLCYRQVVIIRSRRLHIEKIGPFASFNFLGENLFPLTVFLLFHRSKWFVGWLMVYFCPTEITIL